MFWRKQSPSATASANLLDRWSSTPRMLWGLGEVCGEEGESGVGEEVNSINSCYRIRIVDFVQL